MHDVWVEVDLAALRHNLKQVRGLLADGVKLMAVVKANGFGHGYIEPSRAFIDAGADALAVTRLDEALVIRNAGIDAPILLFAPIQSENAEEALAAGLEMTVTRIELVRVLSEIARKLEKTARVHVKVDTGMSRLGLPPAEVKGFLDLARNLPNIEIAGIYTHFATAAERDLKPAIEQNNVFQSLLRNLRDSGIDYGLAHAANSAATLRIPNSHYDMVRPGTILYGQYPSAHVPRNLDLKPTWRLKARVCEIRELPKDSRVGYGGEYIARRPTRTAVIPVGYADGFTLAPEGPMYRRSVIEFAARKIKRSLSVHIRGQKAPVIGRVAMQMTIIDVTDIPGVEVGDVVDIPALRIPTSALIPRVYENSQSLQPRTG